MFWGLIAYSVYLDSGVEKDFMPHIPTDLTLRGQLIDLKPSCEADYPIMQTILSDPLTMRELQYMAHLDSGGWTSEQIRERYVTRRQSQIDQRGIDFLVHHQSSGQICGGCGFNTVDFTHKNATFGLIIHHPFWGTGISAECHFLCLGYSFEKLGLHRIEMATFVTNIRMRKFFERVGIQQEGTRKDAMFSGEQFVDEAVYAVFENEWPIVKERLVAKFNRSR